MRNRSFGKLICLFAVLGLFYVGIRVTTESELSAVAQPVFAADQDNDDNFVWEQVDWDYKQSTLTRRAKIPGGWLVNTRQVGKHPGNGLTFVPDPQHIWDGQSL